MTMYKDYYEAGFKIFGLHGVTKGVCDCGNPECEAFYKHPRVSNWQHTPLWPLPQFEVMEMTGQFSTGFGVLCDGYLIIDIDPRNGGNEGYKQLVKDTGIDYKYVSKFVVETGGGGWHIYFKHDGAEKLHSHLKTYKGIDFKSSGFVVGAGSMHKSGNTYEVSDGFPDEIEDIPQELFDLLVKKIRVKSEFCASSDVITEKEIKTYLSYVPNIDLEYDEWVEVGMIIHESLSGDGFDLWSDWSSTSTKHDSNSMEYKWHSFGKNPSKVTIGTLIQKAKENGYSEPVTFETTLTYDTDQLNTKDINTKKAPGLVGECIDYINGCSRYPRENLAVSAALTAIANIGGLRFEDETYGVTPNLFMFNVAGSATGKEAIQQALTELHVSAGVGAAVYGSIKSEQEIYRNVINHQLIGYSIDEFGITLNKIEQASKGGSASYMAGVIGALMSIYSKANGKLPLGADFAKDLLDSINKQMANINKKTDENTATEYDLLKLESFKSIAKELNGGYISKPFLTLTGYTTPSTFNSLVTYAQATNGFIGRAILFEEKDNNPRIKKGYKKSVINSELEHKLKRLRCGGHASVFDAPRVEFNNEKTKILTNDDAALLLDEIQEELHEKAAHAMETNGLEAIARRSFELVLKVSMILAMGDDGIRTLEHVRWAYALIKQDLENKTNLASANIAEEEKNASTEILSKVRHNLDSEIPTTLGAIANKLRSIKRENIEKALVFLVEQGEVKKIQPTNKTGRQVLKYMLC